MKKSLWALVAAAGLMLSAPASAATLNFEFARSFGGTSTLPGTLPQFDSALGTLTGVALDLFGEATINVERGTFPNRSYGVTVVLENPALQIRTFRQCVAPETSCSATLSASAAPTDLSPFEGPGSFSFQYVYGGSGAFTFRVTYDYDPVPASDPSVVPLPAGLPLLAGGLVALGLVRRRRAGT